MENETRDLPGTPCRKADTVSFGFMTDPVRVFFVLTVLSGVFLSFHYVPAFTQAFSSVERLNESVPFGWMVRRLHGAGGTLLLLLFLIHLIRVFSAGMYKNRPKGVWIIDLLLLSCAVWVNITGFFLPLSQAAFWGTATLLSTLSTLPWIGGWITEFLKGGRELSGITLMRFYAMHLGFSGLIAFSLFILSRIDQGGAMQPGGKWKNRVALAVISSLILMGVTFWPESFVDSLREAANPTLNPDRISLPWYLLFLPETVPHLNASYPFLTLLLFGMGAALLLFLPWIDRNPNQGLIQRPLALSLLAAFLVAGIYFSSIGAANAGYGERVLLPERPLTPVELLGANVFAVKNCAYCHQVAGREGRRQGPDLTVVSRRHRSKNWIQHFVYNARRYQPGSAMPRYEIPLVDLEALSAYLLSLNPEETPFRTMDRSHLMELTLYLEAQRKGKP